MRWRCWYECIIFWGQINDYTGCTWLRTRWLRYRWTSKHSKAFWTLELSFERHDTLSDTWSEAKEGQRASCSCGYSVISVSRWVLSYSKSFLFFWYFDPERLFLDDENKYLQGDLTNIPAWTKPLFPFCCLASCLNRPIGLVKTDEKCSCLYERPCGYAGGASGCDEWEEESVCLCGQFRTGISSAEMGTGGFSSFRDRTAHHHCCGACAISSLCQRALLCIQ